MSPEENTAGPVPSPATGYAATWVADESLETLNRRIHDGVADEHLMDRARRYRDMLFAAYPDARPGPDSRVMELGSGVGWIMEAMLEAYPLAEIVGLDISSNMVKRAQERFSHPAASFVLYDGFTMPFADGHFDVVYSVAAMQHIEKHIAFLLFEELHRVLAPGGHGVIHLLAVDHIPHGSPPYDEECWNHVLNAPVHWHHYYSFDELFVLFAEVIGVTDLDITYLDEGSFLVHFGKGSDRPFLRPELPSLLFRERATSTSAQPHDTEPSPAPASDPAPSGAAAVSTADLVRALASRAARAARSLPHQLASGRR